MPPSPSHDPSGSGWKARSKRASSSAETTEWRFSDGEGSWRHLEVAAADLSDDPAVGGLVLTLRSSNPRVTASGNSAETSGYGTATARVTVHVTAGASSIAIR